MPLHDVPVAEALHAWRDACADAGCPDRVEVVRLPLAEAVGLVTAGAVWATRSSPSFDAAAMDGIAVLAGDTAGLVLQPGAYDMVDTGDPMPVGRDAVVMREHVEALPDGVRLRAAVSAYRHVRSVGEDVAAGELVLAPGSRLRPVDVAAAASAGAVDLLVHRRPRVAVLPTGDEVRPIGSATGPGEILDTNSLMLAAQARELGCEAVVLPIEPDDPVRLAAALRAAAAGFDLVVVIAGSSAGRDDHTAQVVADAGSLVVHGVAVRPGHPVVLGVAAGTPVLGAPGYPVSAALTFSLFAAPLLAALQGTVPARPSSVAARLARLVPSAVGVQDQVRVRLARVRGDFVAAPLTRGAGALTSLVRADGLLPVPTGSAGHAAGDRVRVELLRDLGEIERTVVLAGSHDLALDLLASALGATDPRTSLAVSPDGSADGLVALRDGLCHLAGAHLLDPQTGTCTVALVDRVLPGREVAVVRLATREQGLLVAPGNPLGIRGVPDLARPGLRYVNRQAGSGTRELLDAELTRCGISGGDVAGYARQERTHLTVAATVAAGRADTGLGLRAAALVYGLGFVPVAREPYDLVCDVAALDDPLLAPVWRVLRDPDFQGAVQALGGYSTAETGQRVR